MLAMTIVLRLLVSIHTPTQGVTVLFILKKGIEYVSIHTPTQGVTMVYLINLVDYEFQSTHPRRV